MRSGAIKIAVGLAALAPAGLPDAAHAAAPSGVYEVRAIDTARIGIAHPSRIATAAGGRVLRVGAGGVERRLSIDEQPIGSLRRSTAARARAALDGVRSKLRGRGYGSLRMLARNPANGLVYLLTEDALLAFDAEGRRRHAVGVRRLGLVRPRGIAFARSGDDTDAPSRRNLYIADRGAGAVVEAALRYPTANYSAVDPEPPLTFVRSVATSAFSPSSPDPSGIAYDPAQDRFIISDSEVEEMPLYQGANLFSNPRGTLQGTGFGTTVKFSKEPAGLGYDPATRTLYVSDDDGDRVVVDRPGPDGVHGTRDDVTTRLLTSTFGSGDPEGVEYDTTNGHLYVCDGGDLEVYDWNPGADATFGNADDTVTSFDIAIHGARDCEGLGQDPHRGTLLAIDSLGNHMYELTKTGGLSRVFDLRSQQVIPSTNRILASVTVAPSSDPVDDPGAMSYYITDRHVDNGQDPDENDGLVHELLVGGAPAPPDAAPSTTITQPAPGATVSGTVPVRADATDDNGVTQVRFLVDGAEIGTDTDGSDGWSATWDTATGGNGSRTLVAVATDTAGATGGSAPLTVTVQNAVQSVLSIPVRAGADDASELESGTVNRGSGDLELGSDQGVPTTTGLRFTGLQVPRGAQILSAAVQFNADELNRAASTLTVRAQQADNAAGFTTTAGNVSSRPVTSAFTTWSVPLWTVFGAQGAEQRTPNLAGVVQEIVDRPGWAPGNAIVIVITGSGRRTAESFEGGVPPVLDLEFAAP